MIAYPFRTISELEVPLNFKIYFVICKFYIIKYLTHILEINFIKFLPVAKLPYFGSKHKHAIPHADLKGN